MRTNVGKDFCAAQLGSSSPGANGANWMALSSDAAAPGATDTVLASEITTASGGLVRKQGVYAHTTGASSYTVTAVFTANGSDALPVTVKKVGVFVGAGAVTMPFEDVITDATLNASGDQLTVTQTVSI